MEQTIYGYYKELTKIKNQVQTVINTYGQGLKELNQSISELNIEMLKPLESTSIHELRSIKSNLLNIKSQLTDQIKEFKTNLQKIDQAVILFQKAIQLNTGDIF